MLRPDVGTLPSAYHRVMLRVTVDSTVLDRHMARLRAAVHGLGVEILPTTVTIREHKKILPSPDPVVAESGVYDESPYDSGAVYGESPPAVYETAVLGEWQLGMAVLGSDELLTRYESILRVIGNGSFPPPGKRENLSDGEKHQQRDAMILEAHTRDGRDVLVSDDEKAFIGKDGTKRPKLEALCATRIMTVGEFCQWVTSGVFAG